MGSIGGPPLVHSFGRGAGSFPRQTNLVSVFNPESSLFFGDEDFALVGRS